MILCFSLRFLRAELKGLRTSYASQLTAADRCKKSSFKLSFHYVVGIKTELWLVGTQGVSIWSAGGVPDSQ